jgi:PPOX class probable FMN-dependent enzyme
MADAPFSHLVTSVEELRRDGYPDPKALAWAKEIDHLDEHCAAFLERSPFAVLATSDAAGHTTATPRGGPPGFLRRLDPGRLAFADLTGNNRVDAFRQVLEQPRVGLLVLVPGMRETLRIHGTAHLTRDPEVLRATDVPGRTADLAVGIAVTSAFLQCGKALVRSELWDPATWPAPDDLPSAAAALRDHRALGEDAGEVASHLEDVYVSKLW